MSTHRSHTGYPLGLVTPDVAEKDAMRQRILFLEEELARCQVQLRELEELRTRSELLGQEVEKLRQRLAPVASTFAPSPPASLPELPPSRERPQGYSPRGPSPTAPVLSPDQGIDFGAISSLSPEELDGLPYGMITLDAAGRVLHYNDTESRLVGLPKERVIGRNFFQDIAPCTRLREFEGRFRELVLDPARVRVKTFDFVFRFPRGDQHVTVVMTPAKVRGRFHLALIRRAIES
jgi:photoactive yellow protein